MRSGRSGDTAWVLGGGAAFGALQVGQLEALHAAQRQPDLVVGVSVGALNGAVIAADPDRGGERLRAAWARLRRLDVLPWPGRSPWRARAVFGDAGLRGVIDDVLGSATFADLAVPLVVVAADAATGAPVLLDRGPLAPALLASAALPGLLPAVHVDGRRLVDGGFAPTSPVEVAQARGARRLVTLRAWASPYARGGMWPWRWTHPTLVPAPAVDDRVDLGEHVPRQLLGALDFAHTHRLIALGRAEASEALAACTRTRVRALESEAAA